LPEQHPARTALQERVMKAPKQLAANEHSGTRQYWIEDGTVHFKTHMDGILNSLSTSFLLIGSFSSTATKFRSGTSGI
jgi:hypothetical protein